MIPGHIRTEYTGPRSSGEAPPADSQPVRTVATGGATRVEAARQGWRRTDGHTGGDPLRPAPVDRMIGLAAGDRLRRDHVGGKKLSTKARIEIEYCTS